MLTFVIITPNLYLIFIGNKIKHSGNFSTKNAGVQFHFLFSFNFKESSCALAQSLLHIGTDSYIRPGMLETLAAQ